MTTSSAPFMTLCIRARRATQIINRQTCTFEQKQLFQQPFRSTSSTTTNTSNSRVWTVDNPYNGSVACVVPLHTDSQATALLSQAHATQQQWKSSPLHERQSLCRSFVSQMKQQADAIARDISAQMGKPISQAKGEVNTCIKRAVSLIAQAPLALADMKIPPSDTEPTLMRRISKEPIGVVLALVPWNYPLLCAVNSVIPAVLAGNSVLIKHSDRTPLCSAVFSSVFTAAGAPAHLVEHVHIDHSQVSRLIRHPLLNYVQFTGSVNGGRQVYSNVAADRFIDVGLELGGKDPAYVTNDVDLDTVVPNVVEGALYNAGQSCCAVERVYLHKDIADAFIRKAEQHIRTAWKIGDPSLDNTAVGPLAQAGQPERIAERVRAAVAQGAHLLVGGEACTDDKGKGRFFQPTLLTHCTHRMSIMTEETFGPVVPCTVVKDDAEAVTLMNDSVYGLTASIWTRDVARAEKIAAALDTGTVYMNRCDVLDPELVWSGRKDSGKGFGLSVLGFLPFIRTKSWNFRTK